MGASWSQAQTFKRLGLQPNRIVEAIIATYDGGGKPNAAPMGVLVEADGSLTIKPYTQTTTFKNLKRHGQCTVNLTSSPEAFFRAAFKDLVGGLPEGWFIKARRVNAPRLRQAEGWLEVRVARETESGDRAIFSCVVEAIYLGRVWLKAYCRADFAAIESVIHATRVLVYLKLGEKDRCMRLLRLISHYRSLVERVAPGSEASRVMEGLASILRKHGFEV